MLEVLIEAGAGEYVQDIKNRAQRLDLINQIDGFLDSLPAFFRAAVYK